MPDLARLVIVVVIGLGVFYWVVAYVARTEFGVELPDLFSSLN
jgi:hypothetical protein